MQKSKLLCFFSCSAPIRSYTDWQTPISFTDREKMSTMRKNVAVLLLFSGPPEATYHPQSPTTLYPNHARKLKCSFKGWPIPRVVWLKDGKTVINETNGFYHTEKLSEDYQNTLETSLHLPSREGNEALYKCTANNNICGRSSEKSEEIQVLYLCK